MKHILFYGVAFLFLFHSTDSDAQPKYPDYPGPADQSIPSLRLSNQYMPEFGVWVWREDELLPDGYKNPIDQAAKHSPCNFLIPFLRFSHHEVVDEFVYTQVKLAAEYAAQQNVMLVPDLDVRSARRAFQSKYPDELQQMLRLKEVRLSKENAVETVIPSLDLNDHYTGGTITHHISLGGSLLRVYAYHRPDEGIDPETLMDITRDCELVFVTGDSVKVKIPVQEAVKDGESFACVMVAFTHLYPDIFAPHLMAFQRGIIEQYKDLPLAGVCKDEWGFPPYYPRFFKSGLYDFWYSEHRAKAYTENTGGRDLLADCLLMALGEKGREAERQMAVNRFMDMSRQRNTALEEDFYQSVKAVFGPDAVVSVHSTWWPYPDRCEYMKNGLDWWTARRDWAQTDEVTPYAVRTALCKKWGSPLWYNMYYKSDLAVQVWSSALAGGRIDYLPYHSMFHPGIMRAESRIRLLNYISKSPLDCPVAVIFGHACTMNWAGPFFDDVGMALVDSLWHEGYPADLIPTTEIRNGSLRVGPDGTIRYGNQSYAAVVLYHPEFENSAAADFFNKAASGNTALFRVGDWTKDFNGMPVEGNKLLPGSMMVSTGIQDAFSQVCRLLKEKNIQKQTPATGVIDNTYFGLRDFKHVSCSPPTTGYSRLIDGTVIHVAGTKQVSGDTIRSDFEIDGFGVSIDAVGVAAVRLDERGNLEALAAGSLKSFVINNFEIKLNERVDLALWKDADGEWQGVIQGWDGPIPDGLTRITSTWTWLNIPVPPKLSSAE